VNFNFSSRSSPALLLLRIAVRSQLKRACRAALWRYASAQASLRARSDSGSLRPLLSPNARELQASAHSNANRRRPHRVRLRPFNSCASAVAHSFHVKCPSWESFTASAKALRLPGLGKYRAAFRPAEDAAKRLNSPDWEQNYAGSR